MTDRFIPRTVVVALAVSVIGGLMVMGFLASTQTAIPDSFDRLIFLLAGGLVGVLAKTSVAPDAPANVNVERAEQVGPNPGPLPDPDFSRPSDGERGGG